ncbi:hypothetical protein ACRE_089260 [Hapsidospora chrysogenum ATCC 11550]|uniref:Uncharacterized protein n=1 Tax=Hapsidospora chrysogenum (strain ATCC 11550 / CBS 779.69 / DSM 880 / IAM 14645 / JCM 23072 / IMI 49137) TaxID=857340 RepID=A0A086STI6_HAPC1|nr:hypothetical protein ACRE_089260 [Hapsidospora chrysogenum ATCC 11550]
MTRGRQEKGRGAFMLGHGRRSEEWESSQDMAAGKSSHCQTSGSRVIAFVLRKTTRAGLGSRLRKRAQETQIHQTGRGCGRNGERLELQKQQRTTA